MPLTDAAYPLLMQIPLAGIVVLVVAIFLWFLSSMMKEERAVRMEDNKAMREFLKEQREANNTAISRIAEEVKIIAQKVSELSGVIVAHDAVSRDRSITVPRTRE